MKKKMEHPIRAVSHRTGLPPHIIRVWEKRYQAVSPNRSETNRRSYNEEDIERLRLLKGLTHGGHRISQVAPLPLAELKELFELMKEHSKQVFEPIAKASMENLLDCGLEAMADLDTHALDLCLARATMTMSPLAAVEDLIAPLLVQAREQLKKGKLRLINLQFGLSILRAFLINSVKSYEVPVNAPHLAVATPVGQHQDVEALFLPILAAASGWRSTYFGSNLPADEIAAGLHQLEVKILTLSLSHPKGDPLLHSDLLRLKRLVSEDTKILAIGEGAESYSSALNALGAAVFPKLPAFQEFLESYRLPESPVGAVPAKKPAGRREPPPLRTS